MVDVRTYRTLDRSRWSSGPWDDEPDKVQWIDEDTDFDCLAVRNRMGAWCGYVGVSEGHPWFGVSYSECTENCDADYCYEHTPDAQVSVHGGITFSEFCDEAGDEASSICHVPLPGRPDPVWWFGFDTCHGGDVYPLDVLPRFYGHDAEYRTLAYVRGECALLAAQLAAVKA